MKNVNVHASRSVLLAGLIAFGLLAAGVADATPIVMHFDHFNPDGELVNNYYDGGCGGAEFQGETVTCNGPSRGVVWIGAATGDAANPAGLNDVANEPSSSGVMFDEQIGSGTSAFMNVSAGFTAGFSLYYAGGGTAESIGVYSGLNGTGALLTTLELPSTGFSCNVTKSYSCWDSTGVAISGIAESVDFSNAHEMFFDNVTLGSATPGISVPEPAELGMFGLGLLLLGGFITLHRREPWLTR